MSEANEEQEKPLATEQGADEVPSRWPQPVPEEWKKARAAKAEEWFQRQKEELHGQYHGSKQSLVDEAERRAAASAQRAAFEGRVQAMVQEQQAYSRSVQHQLSVLRQQRLEANLEYEALRLPHFTPPRTLALITAPEGGPTFVERIFNRALATTLMTAVAAAPAAAGAAAAGERSGADGGGGGVVGGGSGSGEAVWCELGQSRVSMQDPPLARAEALERCRLAVVVLSPALLSSPHWPLERKILTARLTAPPGTWPGAPLSAVLIVRLHVPPPASVGEAAAAAVAGMGRKAAAAVAAATAAAAAPDPNPPPPLVLPEFVPGYPVQSYPVTVMDLTVPLPPDPPAEGAAAGIALAQEIRTSVARVLDAASLSGSLAAAGLCLLPDPPPIHLHPAHVHQQPEQLLLAASMESAASGGGDHPAAAAAAATLSLTSSLTLGATLAAAGGSSSSLATQILASPALAAVAPGAAATAAHMLPAAHSLRAVEDWTMYDTAVWLGSLGRSLARWSGGFLALAVDGPLLAVADDTDLRRGCGVAAEKAVAVIRQALESAKRRPGLLPPSRALLPLPDCSASPLPPEAAVMPPPQRAALLTDIFTYYDQDHSGDLSAAELDRLVRACGLRLDAVRLKDVLDDYDDDADGRLSGPEAERLLEDVWRLVMAQQDVAAWTPSESATALRDAIDLEWPLETPRATPDADKTAARTAAARAALAAAGGGRSGSPAGSDAPSINILGSGPGSETVTTTTPPRSVPGAVAAAARSASGRSRLTGGPISPRLVEGEDETGARVRLVDRTGSMAAGRAGGGGGAGGRDASESESGDSGSGGGGSVASYTWGLPPRMPLRLSMSMRGGTSKAVSDAGGGDSLNSSAAPWPGAVTPRAKSGADVLSPEEMAARDVDVQRLLRRERSEAELRDALFRLLDGLDLRRLGRVELQMLRASLASTGPVAQLTPLHTQLLSDIADALSQLPTEKTDPGGGTGGGGSRRLLASGPLGEGLLGLEVPVQSYISTAVPAVVSAQEALLHGVYGERGLSAMLRQLYRQTTGPDDALELLTRGPRVRPDAAEAALEALFEVQAVQPTALLRAALLPAHQLPPDEKRLQGLLDEQAAAAAARGGVTPLSLHSARRYPQSWASATAHVVHVYKTLLGRGGGAGAGAAAREGGA
ncbi:hypothetical protein PLESTB_001788800 [Pleodorina starrii]|uniref:Calmodulin n=1 Tax=Pleodorina starrii TaxID=330485 RepID=A0A9W6FAC8_9CHLO|nr:hypothetical protein PLESTM_001759400 [Pleodorina starrii]GLC61665.1 hypothetical protein PLESTB_001788800 [Pleodorina starrii]GLC76514.1 hypothetical protein PLESTF_001791200 [Pleodorina starrii]